MLIFLEMFYIPISLIGILLLIFIVWESLISMGMVVFSKNMLSSIEWCQKYPPSEHSYSELPLSGH